MSAPPALSFQRRRLLAWLGRGERDPRGQVAAHAARALGRVRPVAVRRPAAAARLHAPRVAVVVEPPRRRVGDQPQGVAAEIGELPRLVVHEDEERGPPGCGEALNGRQKRAGELGGACLSAWDPDKRVSLQVAQQLLVLAAGWRVRVAWSRRWEVEDTRDASQLDVVRVMGSGAFGTVRRAVENADTDKAAEVAIKVLDKKALRRQRVGKRGNALQNVQREVAVWKKLDNQHCVKLFEVIDDVRNDTMYMVAEFVQGGAVMDDKIKVEPLSLAKARDYFRQLLLGVSYLHHNGIVHRDIKPGNLLVQQLSREGDDCGSGKPDVDSQGLDYIEMGFILKLADYGVSEAFGESDAKRTTAGTAAFMAPEMLTGADFSGRGIDLWACGITLYMFLYGTVPFHAATIPDIYEKIQNDAVELPPIPTTGEPPEDALTDLLLTMLAKEPEARFDIEALKSHPWVCGLDLAPKTAEADGTLDGSTAAPAAVSTKGQGSPPSATRAQVRQVEAAGKLRVRARRRHSVLGPERWDYEETIAINSKASVQDSLTESDMIEAVSKVYSLKTILHAKIAARKVKQRATLLVARAGARLRAKAAARAKAELEEKLKAMSPEEREEHFAAQKMQGQWRARDARKAITAKRDAEAVVSSAPTQD